MRGVEITVRYLQLAHAQLSRISTVSANQIAEFRSLIGSHADEALKSIKHPGLPRPDFMGSNYYPIFLHGCETKSGRGRPGYEVTEMGLHANLH